MTYTCTQCGETKTQKLAVLPHVWNDGVVTTAATCTDVGIKTYTCSIGQETRTDEIPALGHAWDEGTITKEPTTAEAGERTDTCIRCGEIHIEPLDKLAEEISFSDVPETTWYRAYLQNMVSAGLIDGYPDNTFLPNKQLTRAEVATILYKRAGKPEVTGTSPYTDVADGAWYTDAILWATETGIVKGDGNGKFRPKDAIKREELAIILWRDAGEPESSNTLSQFTDIHTYATAKKALSWAVDEGIMNGNGNGTMTPKSSTRRCEAVKMIGQYLGLGDTQ
jgi:hypothetical protein